MRWEDERYVRLYTRDTPEWSVLSWEARAVFYEILRKVDRAGVIPLGRSGYRGVAGLLRVPLDVVERAIAELLEDGCLERDAARLVVPRFIEAQEARQSDRARQAASRERARTIPPSDRQRPPQTREPQNTSSQNVTEGHTPSHAVTSCHSLPSLAVPSPAEPSRSQIPPESVDPVPVTTRAREAEPPPTHTRESPRVDPPSPTIAQTPQGPPDAEQLELLLCAHEPTRRLAERPYPERIAGQCISSGITYAIVRAAIEDFAQKCAATAPDMRLDALAVKLGGFILAAKKQAATARLRAEEQARGDPAASKVLEEFDAAWTRAKGSPRVHDSRDEHHAAEVLRLAREASSRAPGNTPEAIVSHVIARHLDERDPLVAQSEHALRLLPSRMSSYGLPPAPRPKKARERPGDMGLTLEEANRARERWKAEQQRKAAS